MELNLKRVISWCLLGLLVLVPLTISLVAAASAQIKEVILVGVVALASMAWLWLSLSDEETKLRVTPLVAVLGFNLLVWVITLLASPYPEAGLGTLSNRFAGLGALLLFGYFLGTRASLRHALAFILVASSIMSIYGILQFFKLDPFFQTAGLVGHFRVSSTASHPNIFITFLVACLPLNLAAFWLLGRRPATRALVSLALLLNVGASGATLSRAGWGAWALTLAFSVVGLWMLSRKPTNQDPDEQASGGSILLKLGVPLLLALIALGGLALTRADLDPGERERLLNLRGPTVEKRLLIWSGALEMARQDPLLGKGLGTFAIFLPEVRQLKLAKYFPRNEYHVDHAVSEPMEVLAESGALGLIAWLMLMAAFFFGPLAAARRARDRDLSFLLLACSAGVLGLVAHGAVEVCLRFHPPMFMLWVLPGLALAATRAAGLEPARQRTIVLDGWGKRLGLSALVGMSLGLVFAYTLSDFVAGTHISSGKKALQKSDAPGAERDFARALATRSGNVEARYLRAFALWKIGNLKEAEAEYRRVLTHSPAYFDANHNLGRVLFEQGKLEEAARLASKATHLNPYHVPSHELAARLAIKQGKLPLAAKLAAHVMKVGDHHPAAHLTLARVKIAQGKKGEARKVLDAAIKRFPEDVQLKMMRRRVEM